MRIPRLSSLLPPLAALAVGAVVWLLVARVGGATAATRTVATGLFVGGVLALAPGIARRLP